MTIGHETKALRTLCGAGLAAVACVCLLIFAFHESPDPWFLGWNRRYVLGAVLPVLSCIAAQAVLVFWPPLRAPRDRLVALACLTGAALVLVPGVSVLPPYELPVMAACLGVMAIPLAGFRASRCSSQWLLSHLALTVVCLAVFVPEVVGFVLEGRPPGHHRLPRWGDESTFRHLFPAAEPFISAGGRLQPNLDLEVAIDTPGQHPYHLKTDSQGFRDDREIPLRKRPGELRVLNLGDSFSVGCGVDQGRFVGTLLESALRRKFPGREVSVLSAEVSDPAYGLLYLQRYGIHYSPDIVLYGYVDNDSHQAYLPFAARGIFSIDARGEVHTHSIDPAESTKRAQEAQREFARFLYPRARPEKTLLRTVLSRALTRWLGQLVGGLRELRSTGQVVRWLTRAPQRDGAGELTFISTTERSQTSGHLRLLDFATNWGMLYRRGQEMTAPLYANLFRVLECMQATATDHGALFVLVYFPRREQVQTQDWRRFRSFWNLDPDDFDLDLEAGRLRSFCDERGVLFVDTTPALRRAAARENLYLLNDLHFNEEGQAVATQAILGAMEHHW
jgi:hypothetical protein